MKFRRDGKLLLANNYEVTLEKLDWDDECEKDFLTGRGFEITEKAFINGNTEKSYYGTHSSRFATDWDDERAFSERYSCKCKETQGKLFEGETCEYCGTEVAFRDVDLRIFGWIKLYDHSIIHPIMYNMIKSVIGATHFKEIITYDKDINRDGHIIDKGSKTNPFKGIGVLEFKERFDEIMYYYYKKKDKKRDTINEIMRERNKIFASAIPVFSSVLRPVSFGSENFFYGEIDKRYNSIVSSALALKEKTQNTVKRTKRKKRMDVPGIVSSIQNKLMKLYDLIFDQINKKEGHIKGQILGGRINFSSRNVIIPDPTLRVDKVRLGYLTTMELFKYEIIAYIEKINNCTYNQAYTEWYKGTIKFDPKIYEIMVYINKKRKPKVFINRNPTINYGSLLCMSIEEIKAEYEDDYTMSLPIQILTVLNADFDGDVLNIVAFKSKELTRAFDRTFNPRKNMFISRNDGLFNNDFNLLKDQIIGLNQFNNI